MNQLANNLIPEVASASHRYCDNCGRPFETIPLEAPHKRFCCKPCREHWHYLQRKQAKAMAKVPSPEDQTA